MSTKERAFGAIGDTDEIVLLLLDNMIWPILAVVIIGVFLSVPQTLLNISSIQLILWGGVPIGLLVLAESICLLSGHFDLSIGAIAGFSGMFTGMVIGNCPACWGIVHNAWVGFGLVVVVGLLIGLTNGIMIGRYNINPFLQTLAFLIIFQGARTALNTQPVTGLPDLYTFPGGTANVAITIMLLAFIIFGVVMQYTRFGQAIYAVGSDEHSAREVGVNTESITIAAFAISGVLSAIAGLMTTGFTGIVPAQIGDGLVFQAFAGAVIGGISLFGGRGKITGALGGVFLIQLIQAALNNSQFIGATQIQMINGIVLLIAILLYSTQESIRNRILSR